MWHGIRDLCLLAIPCITALAAPFAGVAGAAPVAGAPVLVIAGDPAAVVAAADGRPVGPVAAPLAVVAAGDGDFARRLRNAGAWHVTSAAWLASLCLVSGTTR